MAAVVGALSPAARRLRSSVAHIRPAGSVAGAEGPCPVPLRAGPPPCAPGAVPAHGLCLCLSGGGARGRPWSRRRPEELGGGRGASRSHSTPSAAADGGFCSLAGGNAVGGAAVKLPGKANPAFALSQPLPRVVPAWGSAQRSSLLVLQAARGQ